MEGTARRSVAIVTGASSGIGLETARALARRGAIVVLAARRQDRLAAAEREIREAGGEAVACAVDLGSRGGVESLVRRAAAVAGRIDILVNNAGLGLFASTLEMREEDLRRVMEINFFAAVRCTQAVLPHMIGKSPGGAIVNVSSVIGRRGIPGHAAYCASKFALNGFTESLRVELIPHGIHVMLVMPGTTDTEFFRVMLNNPSGKPRSTLAMKSARAVAEAIVRGLRCRRREIITSPAGRILLAGCALLPSVAERALARRLFRRPE